MDNIKETANSRKTMNKDSLYIEGLRLLYPRLQNDIERGINLEENLLSIESCMNEITGFILQYRKLGDPIEVLEQVYEELEAIKKQILQKIIHINCKFSIYFSSIQFYPAPY